MVEFPIYSNPYWRHNNLVSKEELMEFLDKKADQKILKKVVYYFGVYAKHFSIATPNIGLDKAVNLASDLYGKEEITYEDMDKLISDFLDLTLDPL